MPGQGPITFDQILFWVFAVVSVVAAIGMITNRSIIKAALLLLVVFLSQAAFFVLSNADFLAIAQILVYAVGLTIVLLFAIMFTGDKPLTKAEAAPVPKSTFVMMAIIVLYTFGVLLNAINYPFRDITLTADSSIVAALMQEGSTRMLGQILFGRYGLPFELASILLTVAMIGAIVISKKRFEESDDSGVKYSLDLSSQPTDDAHQAYSTSQTRPPVTSEASRLMDDARKREQDKLGV